MVVPLFLEQMEQALEVVKDIAIRLAISLEVAVVARRK